MEFRLYRIQVFFSAQRLLPFDEPISRRDLLRELVEGRPSAEIRRHQNWVVGDVDELGNDGVYFRFGRMRRSTYQQYQDGSFVTRLLEEHPNTHVFLDCNTEVCAICHNGELANHTRTVARSLAKLLSSQELAARYGVALDIREIKDPETLIHYLRVAHSIRSFTFSVSRPNAWDVDERFFRPAQQTVAEIGADEAVISLKGDELDREGVEAIVRSVAATGQDARAKMKMDQQSRAVTRHLRGGDMSLSTDDLSTPEDKMRFIENVRQWYHALLRRNGDSDGTE